jgi:hypothetical protein
MTTTASSLAKLPLSALRQLMRGAERRRAAPVIRRQSRETNVFPQSFSQQRQWFLEQLMPGAVYNVPQALRVRGRLDVGVLERCFETIMTRHESLRTVFRVIDGKPCQEVLPALPLSLAQHDLRTLSAEDRAREAERLLRSEAEARFDIEAGPLWRHALIRLAEEEHLLIVTMHHIVSDGWSFRVAIRELAQLYPALSAGAESPLPPLSCQYVDYSAWQAEWLEGERSQQQIAYWRERLAGAPPVLELPTDFPRPARQTTRGAVHEFALPPALVSELRRLAERDHATLFMVLSGTLALLLARVSGERDVCLGTPVANRVAPELEQLIGLFINTVVLRCDTSPDSSFREYLQRIRETTLRAYDHQDVPFDRLVEELRIDRNLAYSPLFQVLIVQTENQLDAVQLPGLQLEPVSVHSGAAQFDLSFYLTTSEDGLFGTVEYNADLFLPETIASLVRHFTELLARLPNGADRPLRELEREIPAATLRVVIASSFTAEPVRESLTHWLDATRIPHRVQFAPYGQVLQSLLAGQGALATNPDGVNAILLRPEDWAQGIPDAAERCAAVSDNLRDFAEALRRAAPGLASPTLILLCPPSAALARDERAAQALARIEAEFMERLNGVPGVHVFASDHALRGFSLREITAAQSDELGHVPYTSAYFAALGTTLARELVRLGLPRGGAQRDSAPLSPEHVPSLSKGAPRHAS